VISPPGGRGQRGGLRRRWYILDRILVLQYLPSMDFSRHPSTIALVENMLDLHRRLSESKTGHEKTPLSRQIEATDRQIDNLVYELYGLTVEEIAIVEDAAR
jgi:hypothetical protein